MTARILVADDDPKHAHLIRLYLERDGHSVLTVGDGRAALEQFRARRPDLLVLDIMMPRVDGLDVCRIVRAESPVPLMLVTARSTEDDVLLGLDVGADDYLTKPVSPRELAARVRALLRRTAGSSVAEPLVLRVGDLVIDVGRFRVEVAGRAVPLTAKEFGILELLAGTPGRVFTRGEILNRTFGFDSEVTVRTIDAHMVNLRRKIESDPAEPRYLQTVYGRGYRLAEQ
ncbi:MAG TPA: response regulator transcription factor [Actinoplanes sp.]